MKLIARKGHCQLDYMIGAALILVTLFEWNNYSGAVWWVPFCFGIMTVVNQIFLPFNLHLVIDALLALFLGASPWIFGFYQFIYWPFILAAMIQLLVVACTDNVKTPAKPGYAHHQHKNSIL